jgi:plastocyanin
MSIRWASAGAVVGTALVIALGAVVAPSALAADHEITIRDTGFDPATLTVLTGEPVTWTNAASADHTVTTDDQTLDSGPLGPGEAFGHVFDTPGTFAYHDTGTSGFTGTIVVRAAPVTPRPGGSLPPTPPPGTLPPNFSPLPAPSVGGPVGSGGQAGASAAPTSASTSGGDFTVPIAIIAIVIAGVAATLVIPATRRPGR